MNQLITFRDKVKKVRPKTAINLLRKMRVVKQGMTELKRFALTFRGRLRARSEYKKCRTPEDYLKISINEFQVWQKEKEVLDFLKHVAAREPKFVCEIGSCSCGLTFLLAQALNSVSALIGIDWMVRNRLMLHYLSRPGQTISLIDGFSCDRKTLNKVKSITGNRKFDLLFIDGDHSYEGVKEDFLNYKQFVAENGIIAFHDIVPDFFTRKRVQTSSRTGGVPDFFGRISQLYPSVKFVDDPEQDGFGIAIITYSSNVSIPEGLL